MHIWAHLISMYFLAPCVQQWFTLLQNTTFIILLYSHRCTLFWWHTQCIGMMPTYHAALPHTLRKQQWVLFYQAKAIQFLSLLLVFLDYNLEFKWKGLIRFSGTCLGDNIPSPWTRLQKRLLAYAFSQCKGGIDMFQFVMQFSNHSLEGVFFFLESPSHSERCPQK